MASVIDTLYVLLKLDPSNFKKGSRDARDEMKKNREEAQKNSDQGTKSRRQSEDDGKKMSDSAKKRTREEEEEGKRRADAVKLVRNEVLGLLAAFTAGAGLTEFIAHTIQTSAATGRLAANLGISTEALSTWAEAARRVGGDAADAAQSIQALVSQREANLLGQTTGREGAFLAVGREAGITREDLSHPDAVFTKLSALSERLDKPTFTALATRLGITPNFINLLEKGSVGLAAVLDEVHKAGVITEQDAIAAQKADSALAGLGQASSKLGRIVLTELTPAILWLTDALTNLAEWMQAHPRITDAVFAGATAIVTALSAAILVGLVGTALAAVGPAFAAIGVAIAAIVSPIGLVVAGIAGIGVAVYELVKHWDDATAAVERFYAAMGTKRDGVHSDFGGGKTMPFPKSEGGSAEDQAAALIRRFEGFQAKAKYDVNAYRAGYGSDTVTDPTTGKVSAVTSATTVSKEQAEADLKRRISSEFAPKAKASIGKIWDILTAQSQAAIISTAYNYGRVPSSVVDAAKTGNGAAIAAAIRKLGSNNGGINAGRRSAEAAYAEPSFNLGAKAAYGSFASYTANQSSANRSSHSEVNIGTVEVSAPGGDPNTIASGIEGAIGRRTMAFQANSGLS